MFDGLRSRGGIDGSKRGPYQPFGVAWRQIKELRLSYDKKIKEEIDTALLKACSKHKIRVSRSTVDNSFMVRAEAIALNEDDDDQTDQVNDTQCIQMVTRASLKNQILVEEKEESQLENEALNSTYVVKKSSPLNLFKPSTAPAVTVSDVNGEKPHVPSNDSDVYMHVVPKLLPPPHLFKSSNSTSMCTRSKGIKSPDTEPSNDVHAYTPPKFSLPDPPPLSKPKSTSMCTRSKGIKSPDTEQSNDTYIVPPTSSTSPPSRSLTMRTRSMGTESPDTGQSNAGSTDGNELFHTPCEKHARSSSAELCTDIPAKIPASDEDDLPTIHIQSSVHPEKDDRFTALVRNSPVKAVEVHELRTKLLKDKINQKLERDESRRRELEAKKEQNRLDRIKRREERLQKVAANKAALLKKENEKKRKIEASKDEAPPSKTIAASKTEDKGQKNKLRHQAAEQRRKEKERENELKQRAIEKEKQLQEELQRKRMEMKEQIRLKKQLGKDEHKKPVIPVLPPVTTSTTISTASQSIPPATTCTSHYTTPLNKCIATSKTTSTCASSYQITPMSQDPLLVADNNYDIAELSSDDSSDDEDCPKKTVPMWAAPMNLNRIISEQERTDHDIDSIFPPTDLLQSPNLGKIFGFSKRRFLKRTSSAQWTSPMLKKTRPLTENNNNSS